MNSPKKKGEPVTIVLFRNRFKDPDAFDDILFALGKDSTDTSVIITLVNKEAKPI